MERATRWHTRSYSKTECLRTSRQNSNARVSPSELYDLADRLGLQMYSMVSAVLVVGANEKVDGNGWSSRFSRLLMSGSVVMKSTIYPEWNSVRLGVGYLAHKLGLAHSMGSLRRESDSDSVLSM